MKKNATILFIAVMISGLLLTNNLIAADIKISNSDKMFVPGMLLVKFDEQSGNIESSPIFSSILQQYQVEKAQQLFPNQKYKSTPKRKIHDLSRIYKLYVPESSDIEKICIELNAKAGIVYAEPVYIFKVEEVPNDQYYSYQTYLPQIKAPQAWDVAKGDSSVIIAILDTGVDWDHPDLAASIWKNENEVIDGTDTDGNGYEDDIQGWDWVTGLTDVAPGEDGNEADNNPMDFDGHGTHCAGDAAGITNNNIGIASVSWNCSIMPLRVGYRANDGNGYIRFDWAAEAYVYAADNGAHVANLSTGSSLSLADAAKYAFEAGVVVTKSAGNDDVDENDPLDLEPFCISVAAVNDLDQKATYSNYGSWVKVSAPGGDLNGGRTGILSTTFNDTYVTWQGTSFSAPITAGLAGLIKSQHPEWSQYDITFQIINTADNIDHLNPQYAGKLGSGRINAFRAVTEPLIEKPDIKLVSLSIDDTVGGNGNGVAEPGEQFSVIVEFMNIMGTAHNSTAHLIINDWAVEILNSSSNFGDIPGLRDMQNNRVTNTNDPFIFKIDSLALPHRITGVIELNADNNYSQTFKLNFSILPSILLVDDEELDGESYYLSALDSLNVSYVYWNHNLQGTPTNLTSYSTVIWSCEWTFPSLDADDRAVIADYLDNNGNLFLSGQDIGWDLCDLGSTFNEYYASGGTSKIFYEHYLHTQYLLDDSDFSSLMGIPGDPIGDGLSFDVYQPERQPDEQFPSEVQPIDGGVSIFNYPNNRSGAVRYANSYSTVYFAFGGYEAIVQPDVQFTVMPRVLDWLNGLSVSHIPLKDTEDIVNDYKVQVNVIAQSQPIGKVELYWDTDNALPFIHRVSMTDMGDGLYEALIPAQAADTDIQYTIFVQTVSGYYSPFNIYTFHVGSDNIPPTFDQIYQIPQSMNKIGPFLLKAKITDNIALNPDSVYVHYMMNNDVDSLKMLLEVEPNMFGIAIPGSYHYGDTIKYYLTAVDLASIPNEAISDTFSLIIGFEDFENGLDQWEAGVQGWGLETQNPYSGQYHVSDSPGQNYPPGTNTSLQLKTALDFSEADTVALHFLTRYKLQLGKTYGYVEVSIDSGNNWIQVGESISGIRNNWIEKKFSLTDYAGNDNVLFRFRLQADSSAGDNFDGWFIDDVRIVETKATGVSANKLTNVVLQEFFLAQNYPNPFNPETMISYQLSMPGDVSIKIYNALGKLVKTLVHENKPAGYYTIIWKGKDNNNSMVSSGIYFYQMRINDFIQTRKMLYLK